MSTELAEVFSYIRKNYPELTALYNTQVSYLEAITGRSSKTIFLCKEDTSSRLLEDKYVPRKEALETRCPDLDLTGSPLKDICEIDSLEISLERLSLNPWYDCEETYTAISLIKARSILCDYNLQDIGKDCFGSLWILCDAADNDKTILLNIDFTATHNSRGVVYYKGYVPTTKLNPTEMFTIHASHIPGLQSVQTNIECVFNIKSNISLKLSWNSSSKSPSLTNYKNSDVMLYQSVKIGESGSVAEHFWRQLKILSIIKDSILDYKNSEKRNDPVYRCGCGIDFEELREKVMTTMSELPAFYDLNNAADMSELEAVIQKVELREPLNVTDKLWEILRRCSSYKSLKQAFHFVFQCAATCNIVNIPNNQNRLAEIIREVSQRRLAIPSLAGAEPLELLLEIGVEKVFKDYESIFVESKICGSNDLKTYISTKNMQTNKELEKSTLNIRKSLYNAVPNEESVGFQNSKFNKEEIEYTLARLAQIHLALEHLLLIQIHLNLENVYNQIFKELMQTHPKFFDKIDCGVYDKIEIPITTDKVLHHIENKDPHVRRIVMNSKNKFNEVQSTFYYNMDYIFPPNTFEGICSMDEKEITTENMYHHWYYLKIKSKRC